MYGGPQAYLCLVTCGQDVVFAHKPGSVCYGVAQQSHTQHPTWQSITSKQYANPQLEVLKLPEPNKEPLDKAGGMRMLKQMPLNVQPLGHMNYRECSQL